jgi:hypothetical protein
MTSDPTTNGATGRSIRRHRPPPPTHAVPIGAGVNANRDHRADSRCWCGPEPTHRDLGTMAIVFVHRTPGFGVLAARAPKSQGSL